LAEVGGNTLKGWQLFYVREQIADEGENHRGLILAGREATEVGLGGTIERGCPHLVRCLPS
ncbi:MAG: hypothetical protein WAL32_10935, partial [Terriglobales bacterium]